MYGARARRWPSNVGIILLPFRLIFAFFSLLLWLVLLPFRLLFSLTVGVLVVLGWIFVIIGVILVATLVAIVPGALLGLFGLGLVGLARRS